MQFRNLHWLVAAALLLLPDKVWAQTLSGVDSQISLLTTPVFVFIIAGWLAACVWAILNHREAQERIEEVQNWGLRLHGMLKSAPGAFALIDADNWVHCSEQLCQWLKLPTDRLHLQDLRQKNNQGIRDDDFEIFASNVETLAQAGRSFRCLVRGGIGSRIYLVQGRLAPKSVIARGESGRAGAVIWFSDATKTEATMNSLKEESKGLADDLEAANRLIEFAPFPVWRRNEQLELVGVNRAYSRAVEAAVPEEAVTNKMELTGSVTLPGELSPLSWAKKARDNHEIQDHNETVVVEGQRRILQIYDIPLEQSGVGGIALDITKVEEMKVELDRYTRAQDETLNRLSAAVAVFNSATHLRFYNTAFARLFSLDALWLDDMPSFIQVMDKMHENRRLPEERDFMAWKREREAWFTNIMEPVEEIWPLPDNSLLRVVIQPHPFGGLLLIFEDRTEHVSLQSARDTLLKVQQATLNNLYEAVAVFGSDGFLNLYNGTFSTLWSLKPAFLDSRPHIDDLAHTQMAKLIGTSQYTHFRNMVREAALDRITRSSKMTLTDKRHINYTATPLPDGNALLTFIDETDSHNIQAALKERNDALEDADRLKSQFLSNMSYELRTPLTSIIGFTEMLHQDYFGPLTEKQDDYLEKILSSSQRLLLLIDGILDLAFTEAGNLQLNQGDVDLISLTESVLKVVQTRDHKVTVSLAPSLGAINGDERRLQQMLYHLLKNAIDYTPSGGSITIKGRGDSRKAILLISDSGIGIPPSEQKAIFEHFTRGSNVGSIRGAGLGLSLAKQFATLHHGSIILTSRPGLGTTVTIELPRESPKEESSNEESLEEGEAEEGAKESGESGDGNSNG